jgi:glycosyltransferase involved in cell wall biosynthesis
MKKVLAIAPYPYLPFFSGGQKFIAGFYEHLGRSVDLTVISAAGNDPSLASSYKLLPVLKRSFSRYYDLSLVRKITREIQTNGYDTIIWEHPYFAWLARRIKRNTGIKTILHTHNIEYRRFKSTGKWWWPILKRYERSFFQEADLVLFISDEDKAFAINQWKLEPAKCVDVPFGIDISSYPNDRKAARLLVEEKYGIPPNTRIFLFNGLLNYRPNFEALKNILEKINPLLLSRHIQYRILVCGKGLPSSLRGLEDWKDKNVIYAGFVDDIATYFKAADVFLNPVLSGGGVKTKMVEAIAFGTTVVSTETGSVGIRREVCAEKLKIVKDSDWKCFADLIETSASEDQPTPAGYYRFYHWEGIIENLLRAT